MLGSERGGAREMWIGVEEKPRRGAHVEMGDGSGGDVGGRLGWRRRTARHGIRVWGDARTARIERRLRASARRFPFPFPGVHFRLMEKRGRFVLVFMQWSRVGGVVHRNR